MSTNTSGVAPTLRRSISLLLAICILFSLAPAALAASVGSSPSAVSDTVARSFIKLSKSVNIFKTDTAPASGAVSVPTGSVLILVSENTYTVTASDGTNTEYGCLFYGNERYNVLWSDVSGDVLSSTALDTVVKDDFWAASSYPTLRAEYGYVRDMQVFALQLALKTTGFYTSTLDGSYGTGTTSAVRQFQRQYKLDVDGNAGPQTLQLLYPLARSGYTGGGTTGGGTTGGSTGTGSTSGTLTTTASVNLRKSNSTSSARLAVVPKKVKLTYTNTRTSGSNTWYYVTYNSLNGWLLGTFVSAGSSGGSSGGNTGNGSSIGVVTITMSNTRIRKTPNGAKSGYVLAKGSTVSLMANPTTAGGYTWYYIQTSAGVKGYVRGDCASITNNGGNNNGDSSTIKTYVQLTSALTIYPEAPNASLGSVSLSAGTVIQMVSPDPYTNNSIQYVSVFHQSIKYYCELANFTPATKTLTSVELADYITKTVWTSGFTTTLKESLNLIGDIRVHALQYALSVLGYYTGSLDGNFGSGTTSAVRNFQRQNKLTVDGSVGPLTYPKIIAQATNILSGGSGGGSSTEFGTINSIQKANWDFGNQGANLFPKNTDAQVMDVATGRVFTVYRIYGGNHADAVPKTEADTKTMAEIIGFPYTTNRPSSSQLAQIVADGNSTTYVWPDFKGTWTTPKTWDSGAWDSRAALLNVGGTVYCVSIYGWPHGYSPSDTAVSRHSQGNNYYGMMCIHFVNSKTHGGGTVSSNHQSAINTAYTYAKSRWPGLVK